MDANLALAFVRDQRNAVAELLIHEFDAVPLWKALDLCPQCGNPSTARDGYLVKCLGHEVRA